MYLDRNEQQHMSQDMKKLILLLSLIAGLSLVSCVSTKVIEHSDGNAPFTPEKILPVGADSTISINPYTLESGEVRKGTVAATLNNIALLNQKLSKKASKEEIEKIDDIIDAIKSLLPSLRVIGVFDLFTKEEWISSDNQPGRVMAGVLYLQRYPQEVTEHIKKTLIHQAKEYNLKLLSDEINKIVSSAQ